MSAAAGIAFGSGEGFTGEERDRIRMITDAKSLPRQSRSSSIGDPIGKTCRLKAHPGLINDPDHHK